MLFGIGLVIHFLAWFWMVFGKPSAPGLAQSPMSAKRDRNVQQIDDGGPSMILDDFLANLSHAQELNFIDLLFILDGRLMILEDFVTNFLICLHNKDLRAPHWHPLFIDSGIKF